MTYKMDKKLESGLRRAYEAAKADAWLVNYFDGVIRINGREFPINGFIGTIVTDTVYIRNGHYNHDHGSQADILFRFNPEASFDAFKQTIAWMVAYYHNLL